MATKHDYWEGDATADSATSVDSTTDYIGQTFTASASYYVTTVKIYCAKTPSADIGTVSLGIRETSGGDPIGLDMITATVDSDDVPPTSAYDWVTFTFTTGTNLTSGSTYAIVVRADNAAAARQFYMVYENDNPYAGGTRKYSTTSGATWTSNATDDCLFSVWGDDTRIIEKTYSRRLISIGNNEVWYESSLGTMTELAAANGGINTLESLSAVEAFQKLFIVNKTNLKVLDYVNTKINTADAGLNPCTKGMTLVGATSGASMIVDYADGVTDDAAANVYGYRTTVATFSSGEVVSGTNGAGNAVSFTTSAVETAPPHWYNWTVFGNDTTTYGTMPTSSTIVSLYRGRIVMNDVNRPHAWYMAKVEDPWKMLYDFTNDGNVSAVTYTNTTVGQIGDIITAIIPYKDDLLIWGCANSIWILVGDPLGSGQNARITDKTGIWGSRAWCIDNKNNLYFLGEDGIYRMPISDSYSPPENISKLKLPNIIATLDLDKNLHRVTMGFDPINYGIHICKTLLSDGTNSNYWFDLVTNGFYPESYPTSCGVFSSYYYPATDDSYKKYLVGCTDGYIREFSNTTENDATTSSTSAITSYAGIIGKMADDEDHEGIMTWINAVTSGGASAGDFSDSDSVEYSLFTGDDGETVLEDIKDGATAFTTGEWDGTGKQTKNRTRMRGSWYGLKIGNDEASETWSLNNIYCNIKKAGKLR